MGSWEKEKRELSRELLRGLYEARMFRTWLRDRPEGWELFSGSWSPFYFSMRDVPADPEMFRLAVRATTALLKNQTPRANRIVGLAAAGVPIAAAVGYEAGISMGFTRKLPNVRSLEELEVEVHKYGGHRLVEGKFEPGDRVVIFDDVVSHFDSKEIGIRQFQLELASRGTAGVEIDSVVVLIDRGHGAQERAEAFGVRLESLLVLSEDCKDLLSGIATDREIEVIQDYLHNPDKYQSAAMQEELKREATARLQE